VLSGNRNFEGRIHPAVKANYLASPPLVVAYALAGSMRVNLAVDPLGTAPDGTPVYLRDIWPSNKEIADTLSKALTSEMFRKRYGNVLEGPVEWRSVEAAPDGQTYHWDSRSTYVQHPPYFEGMPKQPPAALHDIAGARILAILGDSITTDHISPAGSIKRDGPAGQYLTAHHVGPAEFNSYGARRGNHEVLMRGTFANIRLQNEMVPGVVGGVTRHFPSGDVMPIYDVAVRYKAEGVPLVVVAGKEYGAGSSRDWAAKGPLLLGVKAVLVESFERIHRSNLIGMGVLPIQFEPGTTRKTLRLEGTELIEVIGLSRGITPHMTLRCRIIRDAGGVEEIPVLCRIDTDDEVEYYRHGGILQYVLRHLAAS